MTFAFDSGRIVHIVDHKPKTTARLQRLANIRVNPEVSLLVDNYEDDWSRLWWVRVDGMGRVVEEGAEWEAARAALTAKYPLYVETPPLGPAVVITIDKVTAWVGSG